MRDEMIKAAIAEVEQPTWGVTKQYLAAHNVVKGSEKLVVERSHEDQLDSFVVYFKIEGQEFYLAVYLDVSAKVQGVDMTAGNRVYLSVTSDEMSYSELSQEIQLEIAGGWNKGEIVPPQLKVARKYSALFVEPIKDKFESFEHKIENLLSYLESDADGVKQLVNKADAKIRVCWDSYIGNGCLGGIHLTKDIIERLNKMSLSIDFDLYANGKPF